MLTIKKELMLTHDNHCAAPSEFSAWRDVNGNGGVTIRFDNIATLNHSYLHLTADELHELYELYKNLNVLMGISDVTAQNKQAAESVINEGE